MTDTISLSIIQQWERYNMDQYSALYEEIIWDDPGSLDDRYQIYLGCVEGTGQPVKDYDEWLQS